MLILDSLDREWEGLACGPQARRALIRWSRSHPALCGLADLAELLDRRRDPDLAGGILAALAALAPSDELAARTLLQAMLPGFVRLAQTAGWDDPRAIDEIVSLGWERIRTYPTSRTGSVAANVLWDTRKRYRRHRTIEAPTSLSVEAGDFDAPAMDDTDAAVLGQVIVAELDAARRAGVVSDAALELIVRTRVNGESLADLAAAESVSVHRLAQRRWRAERRLRELAWAS